MSVEHPLYIFSELLKRDWHLHDSFSHDGTGTAADYAEKALAAGLESICITNHIECINPATGQYEIVAANEIGRFRRSLDSVKAARGMYPELEILFGIEIDNSAWAYSDIEQVLEAVPFDKVIGSVHFIGDLNFSGKKCIPLLKKLDPVELYEKFYHETLEFINRFDFDILGHPDLIKRNLVAVFPEIPPKVEQDVLNDIFSVMVKKDIALEINTGGYFQAPQESYPDTAFIRSALNSGIRKFSVGSDAHSPDGLARGYSRLSDDIKTIYETEV